MPPISTPMLVVKRYVRRRRQFPHQCSLCNSLGTEWLRLARHDSQQSVRPLELPHLVRIATYEVVLSAADVDCPPHPPNHSLPPTPRPPPPRRQFFLVDITIIIMCGEPPKQTRVTDGPRFRSWHTSNSAPNSWQRKPTAQGSHLGTTSEACSTTARKQWAKTHKCIGGCKTPRCRIAYTTADSNVQLGGLGGRTVLWRSRPPDPRAATQRALAHRSLNVSTDN